MPVRRKQPQRKPWRRPKLLIHGTVESLTKNLKGCAGGDALGLGELTSPSGPCQ